MDRTSLMEIGRGGRR